MDRISTEDLPFGFALHRVQFEEGKAVDFRYLEVNAAFAQIIGFPRERIVGTSMSELFPLLFADRGNTYIRRFQEALDGDNPREFELYIHDLDRYYKVRMDLFRGDTYVSFLFDISAEVKRREMYKSAFLSISDGVIAVTADLAVSLVNRSAERMTGVRWKEAEGKPLPEVLSLYRADGAPLDLAQAVRHPALFRPEALKYDQVRSRRGGMSTPVEVRVDPISSHGVTIGHLIHLRDVGERVRIERQLSYVTYHDALTGLYNRQYFNEQTPAFEKEENLPLSLIMGDVNGLKLTNDAFGHLVGDEMIKTAARAVESACRSTDAIVRWGGDEFVVLLPRTDQAEAAAVCDRIRGTARGRKVGVMELSISLGYATRRDGSESISHILKTAEDMMYDVKLHDSRSFKSKTLGMITRALYARSRAESFHSENVGRLCGLTGRAMGMEESRVSELFVLGRVHDIGKIGIDGALLEKPAAFTEAEWAEVRRHPEIGYHILVSSNELAPIARYVLTHHERPDGAGYPKGLKGETIPLQARIVAVCGAYDAMTAESPYRHAFSREQAVDELRRCAGTQFDPAVVAVFIEKVLDVGV